MTDIIKKEGAESGDFRSDNHFLLGYFEEKDGALYYRYDAERVIVEPWGENSLRVRASKMPEMPQELWALEGNPKKTDSKVAIHEYSAEITNGKIRAVINNIGKLFFYNQKGELLLEEYVRNREDMFADTTSSLEVEAREFKPIIGGDYELTMRFVSNPKEKLYGMGQYQQDFLNIKGAELELAHRNSQASVPFALSSLGYGFLWNNPAIGRVSFNKNITTWQVPSTKKLDYWITAGDTPAEIEEAYADATGKVPMMPEYGLGFWQCKLRYQTQEELLEVAREYHRRGIPIDVIVVDFFHWPKQGDWRFDPTYWPDPDAMIAELKEMGIELMVSVWPMVDYKSENFDEMKAKGLLTRVEKGVRIDNTYMGNTIQFDSTNPEAREYVWEKIKKNYYDQGAKLFWLDVAEPEYSVYDFKNYRYQLGSVQEVGNIYPKYYLKAFYDGMTAEGDTMPISLIRSAWAGSAKYGALVWSGDIVSTFECFRRQVQAGLNMAIAGIPWWTTDIGGFHGARTDDPDFHRLYIRWFEYGCFCPVMRLHGNRNPQEGYGAEQIGSGSDNEIWSFSDEAYEISKKYIFLRERLRDYIRAQMKKAHEDGTPVMRPVFYDFPADQESWNVEDAYLFGPDLYVAPVMEDHVMEREVYLPAGTAWFNAWTGEKYEGGQKITVAAPMDTIPVFVKEGADTEHLLNIFSE